MALFRDSTQASFWIMDLPTIISHHTKANQSARHARQNASQEDLLSEQDEARIRDFHQRRILRFINQIRFPDKVAATAITYFKRYFLTRSVMDYNPSVIALCALYAAFKVEEVLMSADDLVSRVDIILNGIPANADIMDVPFSIDGTASRVTSDTLLKIELPFLQQINFHLICYHPLRSLGIIRQRLSSSSLFPVENNSESQVLSKVINRASRIIMLRAMISDLPLSHPPAVITIAATAVACGEADGPSDDGLFQVLMPGSNEIWDTVRSAVDVLRGMGDRPLSGETERVAGLEKRRRRVKNEENDPTTSAKFQEQQQDKLAKEDMEEAELGRNFQEKLKKRAANLLGFGEQGDSGEEISNGRRSSGESARKRVKLDV